jgi:hypothetical protein
VSDREKDLEELVRLQEKLLAAYRTGGRPSGATLDGLTRLKAKLGLR